MPPPITVPCQKVLAHPWLAVSRSHGKIGSVTVSDLCEGRLEEIEAADEVPAP
jgi:hypothetical protein